MTDNDDTPTKTTEGEDIFNTIMGSLMLTLPCIMFLVLKNGGDFITTYIWYWRICGYAIGVAGLIIIGTLAVKRRFPAIFENPPKSPAWLGFVCAGVALVTSVAVGYRYDAQTGGLLFWPSLTLALYLIGGLYWLWYQIQRWRTKPRT